MISEVEAEKNRVLESTVSEQGVLNTKDGESDWGTNGWNLTFKKEPEVYPLKYHSVFPTR